jgi:hypothetical protein
MDPGFTPAHINIGLRPTLQIKTQSPPNMNAVSKTTPVDLGANTATNDPTSVAINPRLILVNSDETLWAQAPDQSVWGL